MFVLVKETSVDGYYTAFDRFIACSSEYEVIEKLELTLHEEKENFISSLENEYVICTMEFQQQEFKKQKTLSKYFNTYMDVVDGYFNFEIHQVEEI